MKKIIMLILVMAILGCGEKLQTYLDEPQWIIRDPHYAEYQDNLDALEHEYLSKEITYAEYMERKQSLDDRYTADVQRRKDTIESHL